MSVMYTVYCTYDEAPIEGAGHFEHEEDAHEVANDMMRVQGRDVYVGEAHDDTVAVPVVPHLTRGMSARDGAMRVRWESCLTGETLWSVTFPKGSTDDAVRDVERDITAALRLDAAAVEGMRVRSERVSVEGLVSR